MLTALELARQARIAANRAYLAGLQKGPDAMSKGEVQPLQVADPAVLAAARQLATSAALCQAKNQVGTNVYVNLLCLDGCRHTFKRFCRGSRSLPHLFL